MRELIETCQKTWSTGFQAKVQDGVNKGSCEWVSFPGNLLRYCLQYVFQGICYDSYCTVIKEMSEKCT